MIKSIAVTNKPTEQLYPYISKGGTLLKPFYVLFTSPDTGTVIFSNNPDLKVGYYSTLWAEEDCFTKNDDISITLTNKP